MDDPYRETAPDPALIAFGRLVRQARRRAWLNQVQFGTRVGLDQGSVSRLENGKLRSIRLDRLAPILVAMDVLPPERPGREQGAAPPEE